MKTIAILAAAIVAATAMPALAANPLPVVDQSDTKSTDVVGALNRSSVFYSQSFVAGYDNSVGGGFYLFPYRFSAASGTVTISLFADPVTGPTQAALASGSVSASSGGWADAYWSKVSLVKGATYYLGVRSDTNLYASADGIAGYASGDAYSNSVAQAYDLTFRTYADPTAPVTPAAPVPEPAAWAMMMLGVGAVGYSMRRGRQGRARVRVA